MWWRREGVSTEWELCSNTNGEQEWAVCSESWTFTQHLARVTGSPPHLWSTELCGRWGGKQTVMDQWVAFGWPLVGHTWGDFLFLLKELVCKKKTMFLRNNCSVSERLFYSLNTSFVFIGMSQAIKEPGKILTLNLKCYQHVCCQCSDQIWRLSACLSKSWEVQVTQVNMLWQCRRPVMSSVSVQPRQHGQHHLLT